MYSRNFTTVQIQKYGKHQVAYVGYSGFCEKHVWIQSVSPWPREQQQGK